MKIIYFIISILFVQALHSQEIGFDTSETVIVHKDPRFDELANMQAQINKRALRSGPRRVRGFRIQAANTQNRDEANAVKADLLKRFPDEKSYLLYQSPSYKVRIGNFLTQRDAFQLRKIISAMYPGKGIYIVPDVVEYTPPAEDNDDLN